MQFSQNDKERLVQSPQIAPKYCQNFKQLLNNLPGANKRS